MIGYILFRYFLYEFFMEQKPLCPFGDILVKARKDRGITQYRLAKLTKRSARYLSMLEHNKREPQLSTVLMLARALRMDPGKLVQAVDALMPEDWGIPDEEDIQPKKTGRPKKKVQK